jgi:ATP-binding cassette subfamily B protein
MPGIYLFDDSFSALDLKTDARLRAELRASIRAKNPEAVVLVVAQRVGTVVDADRIIVLDEGKIAGIGTHAELSRACSVYQEIAESQLGIRRTA